MRFEQFERDALINYGKKHGYITEGMSQEQIDEILPAVAAAGRMAAKGVGAAAKGLGKVAKGAGKLAVKGAKAAAPHLKKAAVATGKQIKKGAKAVGGAVAGAVANQQAQGQASEVPPGADMQPSPTGQAPDPQATQKVAQRATALKGVAGGSASGSMVAKGLDKVGQGSTLPPNLIKAIAPYTQSIQTIMQDPQLFGKFKLLMKQAKAGQANAQQ